MTLINQLVTTTNNFRPINEPSVIDKALEY